MPTYTLRHLELNIIITVLIYFVQKKDDITTTTNKNGDILSFDAIYKYFYVIDSLIDQLIIMIPELIKNKFTHFAMGETLHCRRETTAFTYSNLMMIWSRAGHEPLQESPSWEL